jgi:hypothetical protein
VVVGECDTRADDLLVARGADERHAGGEAEVFLRSELRDGPRLARELFEEARELDIAEKTLKRARKAVGVVSQRVGGAGEDGRWEWSFPKGANPTEDDDPLSDGPLSENPGVERNFLPSDPLGGHPL